MFTVIFRRLTGRFALVAGLLVACALPATAFGQATRTWVSGVGDDANPCSRTAPCKTFAGAISKTASGGEINALDPGGFGAVTITKPITIKGKGTLASVLVSGTNGIVINTPGANDRVRLYGLELNGIGTGINGVRILQAKSVRIEHCEIFGFTNNGVDFEPSNANAQLLVQDTSIDGQIGGDGVGVLAGSTGAKVTIRRGTIDDNLNGIIVSGVSHPASVTVTHAEISDNSGPGIFSVGAGSTIRIGSNEITDNGTGLLTASGGQILSFADNLVTGNTTDGAPTGPLARL